MKSILVINAHPNVASFCNSIAQTYIQNATAAGHTIDSITLHEMQFDFNLKGGYQFRTEWENDLHTAWTKITKATHIVIIYPTWWGTMPANLKGFFDRLFLPGKAFQYRENSVWWDKLLKGKTAHIITTLDTPQWYYKIMYSNAGVKIIKNNIFGFCGIKTTKTTYITPVKNSTATKRTQWLEKISRLGTLGI